MRKPNENSTKTFCYNSTTVTSPTHPVPLCNDNRTQTAKNSYHFQFLPFLFYHRYFFPPPPHPSSLCSVDVGIAACQDTVLDPENNIESGGGGGGGGGWNSVSCTFTSERAWKGDFLIGFVHVRLGRRFPNFR